METIDSDSVVTVDDEISAQEEAALHPLVADITSKFETSKATRYEDESRWNRAYYNFRGLYGKEIAFREDEKSRVFVKVTKTKVMAAYGHIADVLFSNDKIPITIEATPDPEGIEEEAHIDMQDAMGDQKSVMGFTGDGKDLTPGETLKDRVGAWLAEKLEGMKIKPGPATDMKTQLDLSPAEMAAKRMDKKIHDQFVETDALTVLAAAAFEAPLLGTGIIKGPFAEDKEYPRWEAGEDGVAEYKPLIKTVPKIEHVSCWDFYPDPEADNMNNVDWVIQRHKLTRTALRDLKKRPHFRSSAIEECIINGPNWNRQWWEIELEDNDTQNGWSDSRYEVLEYWGNVDGKYIEDLELDVDVEEDTEYQINAWVCGGELLRVVINPFQPKRIPYHVVPYELNPYHMFGVGVPENMEDSQTLMNGFARLAVDNAALSGSLMIEVDESNLVPGHDMRVYPGKVWRRSSGAPGQAIFGTKWPNTTNENMMVFDKFRQFADETVGIPSYSHGQTGVSGTGRTAAGMSMLMGASSLNIKTVIKNFDNFLLKPLGKAMFAFNMQFDYDDDIKGDLEVKASGTASLMQREVKSQRIVQLIQTGSNPMVAPWINFEYLAREAAKSLELNEEKAINNPKMAALQAQMLGAMGGMMQQGAQQNSTMTDPNQVGGGNIGGGGAPPIPGADTFSGTQQVENAGPTQQTT